jgi:hypothetical protein
MKLAENVAHMEGREIFIKSSYGKLKERARLEDLGINGIIILN